MKTLSIFDLANLIAAERDLEIMQDLGFNLTKGRQIRCACPIHQGDNKQGFTYTPSKKIWKCWTNGCHNTYGSNILGLVSAVKKISKTEAAEWIIEHYYTEVDSSPNKIFTFNNKNKIAAKDIFLSEQLIAKFPVGSKYFESLGFSKKTIETFKNFEVDDPNHVLYMRACIPVYDLSKKFLGVVGRSIDGRQPKWLNFPRVFPSGRILFNLDKACEYIKNTKSVILVEGPKDVQRLYENGIYNCVSLLGHEITKEKIQLLIKCGTNNLILCLDPDESGRKGTDKIIAQTKNYFNIFDLRLSLEKDIGDSSNEDIMTILKPELDKICQTK